MELGLADSFKMNREPDVPRTALADREKNDTHELVPHPQIPLIEQALAGRDSHQRPFQP
jgi:hypothetical protein